ncbi:MAG: PhzF family phenazine biosynthesis protein [Methanothrix sp.]|uniref:PhzF family phenazine biosynthesis protein n=1 Tax=Methanothrix sp. TaxID=90426 RepID=UPI003C70ABAA
MRIPLYHVDAFTSEVFSGNPAAVCLLDHWIDEPILQAIAAENNLSETAFLVPSGDGFQIRWLTPLTEVALCGHSTLASAFVLFNCCNWPQETIRFQTRKSGELAAERQGDLLQMSFPAIAAHGIAPPTNLKEALAICPEEVLDGGEDLMVLLENEDAVREVKPDFRLLAKIDCRGVIVTARGDECDFVSRFFTPRLGIPEDPVTGSSHCVLAPYWAEELGRKDLYARQLSKRGGELFCTHAGKRVKISGRAALYMEGTIWI